ncbi:hypothetical protein EK904_002551 [Melospiza melodia maxima]|nr:hypothetical protein EK904_002551 [Melospiza melodia maxima]
MKVVTFTYISENVTVAKDKWIKAMNSCGVCASLSWQPRWFVLDNGILSYYDSQDDVCKGSKGSIKMAVCEIKVHATDNTRMELIIPGEQHFYMKAVNAAERQRWLVALGSAKACLADTRTKKEKEISETNESLKTKMSELRLYCDLLMQQVHTIQEFVHHDETRSPPSIEVHNSRIAFHSII